MTAADRKVHAPHAVAQKSPCLIHIGYGVIILQVFGCGDWQYASSATERNVGLCPFEASPPNKYLEEPTSIGESPAWEHPGPDQSPRRSAVTVSLISGRILDR